MGLWDEISRAIGLGASNLAGTPGAVADRMPTRRDVIPEQDDVMHAITGDPKLAWLDELLKGVRNAVEETDSRVHQATKPKPKPKPKPGRKPVTRRPGMTAPADPYAGLIASLSQPMPTVDTNSKQFRQSRQKQINQALLAARAPWDQQIVQQRNSIADALKQIDKTQASVLPMMTGTARGQEMLAQSDRKNLDAARDASLAQKAQDAAETARALGISEESAKEAGALGALTTQAEANAAIADTDRRADASKGLASDIQASSQLQSQEMRQKLVKESQREIGRLRAQRAAGMAQARGSIESELASWIQEQLSQSNDMAFKQAGLLMDATKASQDHRFKLADLANDQQALALKAQPKQMNPMDAFKFLADMSTRTVGLTEPDEDGNLYRRYKPAYAPEQIDNIAQVLGLPANPFALPSMGPQKARGVGGINDYIRSIL